MTGGAAFNYAGNAVKSDDVIAFLIQINQEIGITLISRFLGRNAATSRCIVEAIKCHNLDITKTMLEKYDLFYIYS